MKIKNISSKARYFVIGLIALEIASIPVSAQIIKKVAFTKPQKVIAAPFPPEVGVAKFLVSSDAPFAITSENAIGDFHVNIYVSGSLNSRRFGTNAQMPGAAETCTTQTSLNATKIYEAVRKTAAHEGDIVSQAVIVEIRYDAEMKPDLKIITEKKGRKTSSASACLPKLS